MAGLAEILLRASQGLPAERQAALRRLFATPLHQQLAERLQTLHKQNGFASKPGPFLEAETTPPLEEVFEPFALLLKSWSEAEGDGHSLIPQLTELLATVPTTSLLVLLGQRVTPGSLTDEQAFPPNRTELLTAACAAFDGKGGLSCSARALSKHTVRGEESFWGKVSGSTEQQNKVAEQLIHRILKECTWWNVFRHFQHGVIYEARVESGHGARWTIDGHVFIGFVDPFDPAQRLDGSGIASSPTEYERSAEEIEAEFGPLPVQLDRDELQKRYAAGQRTFHGVNLSAANLSNLDLRGIDLTGAKLTKAKLFHTNLEGATLTECDLSGTYLVETFLSGSTARRAKLSECRMDGVKWSDLDWEGARFDRASLKKAELKNCRMKRVGMAGTDLTAATLDNIAMHGAFLVECTLTEAKLNLCRGNRANLSKSDLTKACLENCNFEAGDLTSANFAGAKLNHCQFVEANLTSADFSAAELQHAKFENALLERAQFVDAKAPGVSLVRAKLAQANLKQAMLENANFEQADLSRTDFHSANLKGADLSGSDLTGADVVNTQVDARTNFRAAKTINIDFGTNWALRQRVIECSHDLAIRQFRDSHPVLGFFWWAMLGCGKKQSRLLWWGIAIVFVFAGLMAISPGSFNFGQANPSFLDHLRNSLAMFVTLDLAVDKGTDDYGKTVMVVQALLSYIMLGFMASLFSSIFPNPPE